MKRNEEDPSHPRPPLVPWVLLLLAEQPAHGYGLAQRLRPMGFEWSDPGPLYHDLRRLQDEGWLSSDWDGSKRGPPRRVYNLTPKGRAMLDQWAQGVGHLTAMLGMYQSRYARLGRHGPVDGAPMPSSPKPSS